MYADFTNRAYKLTIIAIPALVIIGLVVFFSVSRPQEQPPQKTDLTAAEIGVARASTKVYLQPFLPYRQTVDQNTRSELEKMLYKHARILAGDDLYTGVIRADSYGVTTLDGGDLDLRMIVDIMPIDVAYVVSVKKNASTNQHQAYFIACVPKSEQRNKSLDCKDERGR